MYIHLFTTTFHGLKTSVKYETDRDFYLCELENGEDHFSIKQNDQGEWFELMGGFTFLAENLGRLVEEKMEERVL